MNIFFEKAKIGSMSTSIGIALISLAGSILVATISFVYSKWKEHQMLVMNRKLGCYNDLITVLHLFGGIPDKYEKQRVFAEGYNKTILFGSKKVIDSLNDLMQVCAAKKRWGVEFTKCLTNLIYEMRCDIQKKDKSIFENYDFRPLMMEFSNKKRSRMKSRTK